MSVVFRFWKLAKKVSRGEYDGAKSYYCADLFASEDRSNERSVDEVEEEQGESECEYFGLASVTPFEVLRS